MTDGAHAHAREVLEKIDALVNHKPFADIDSNAVQAIVEAYGQAVERETCEQCAKQIEQLQTSHIGWRPYVERREVLAAIRGEGTSGVSEEN